MTTTPPTSKRRTDRLMLTIPLIAQGHDAQDEVFEAPARTLVLNMNGALIQIPRALRVGQTVHLINLIGRGEADFRVVGAISSTAQGGGNYGVECLDPDRNIWQIYFLPPPQSESEDTKALLECRMCRGLVLASLSPGELEVLRTASVVAKTCPRCNAVTPWKYAEISGAELEPMDQGWVSTAAQLAQRRHRRVCMQLAVSVRGPDGAAEIARTENISKEGFCFVGEKDYEVGEQVRVTFPGKTSDPTEIPAHVVWRRETGRANRKVYGISCKPPAS